MESEKYLEGKMTFKPPFFENISFHEWKIRFESYVKSIDYDLWLIISSGDFQPTKTIFERQEKCFTKMLNKNNEAKIIIFKALPRNEYERIFFCQTANDMWNCLLNTHQEECFVKESSAYKMIVNESIVDKYLVEMSTNATNVNILCEGKDDEYSMPYVKNKQEGCLEITIEKESSDDDDSSSESEDEEYAKVVKEFKSPSRQRRLDLPQVRARNIVERISI